MLRDASAHRSAAACVVTSRTRAFCNNVLATRTPPPPGHHCRQHVLEVPRCSHSSVSPRHTATPHVTHIPADPLLLETNSQHGLFTVIDNPRIPPHNSSTPTWNSSPSASFLRKHFLKVPAPLSRNVGQSVSRRTPVPIHIMGFRDDGARSALTRTYRSHRSHGSFSFFTFASLHLAWHVLIFLDLVPLDCKVHNELPSRTLPGSISPASPRYFQPCNGYLFAEDGCV